MLHDECCMMRDGADDGDDDDDDDDDGDDDGDDGADDDVAAADDVDATYYQSDCSHTNQFVSFLLW